MTCLHVCVSSGWGSSWTGGCTLPPGNPRSSGTALETELAQGGRGCEHQASSCWAGPGGTQGHRGVRVCGNLSPPTVGTPSTSASAPPPPFLTRSTGSVLSCCTSSLLGGFGRDTTAAVQGLRGFPSIRPGRGAARGSPAASWLCFSRVRGKGGAVWNNKLSVDHPSTLSRTTLTLGGLGKALLHKDQTWD